MPTSSCRFFSGSSHDWLRLGGCHRSPAVRLPALAVACPTMRLISALMGCESRASPRHVLSAVDLAVPPPCVVGDVTTGFGTAVTATNSADVAFQAGLDLYRSLERFRRRSAAVSPGPIYP